jgi:hypothetical protein
MLEEVRYISIPMVSTTKHNMLFYNAMSHNTVVSNVAPGMNVRVRVWPSLYHNISTQIYKHTLHRIIQTDTNMHAGNNMHAWLFKQVYTLKDVAAVNAVIAVLR